MVERLLCKQNVVGSIPATSTSFYYFLLIKIVLKENIIVHTIWIGEELSLLEQLTIKLLQSHGHQVHLWAYDAIKNVPEGTVSRNAEDILPKSSIFKYNGKPLPIIPNGGIGSLSHWSDQFQINLLYKEGGIYLQLDVACLKPLNFELDYAFVSHQQKDVAAFLMKCPSSSNFCKAAGTILKEFVNEKTIVNLDWDSSMRIIGRVLQKAMPDNSKYQIPSTHFWDLGCKKTGPFFANVPIPSDLHLIHWSNATVRELKNNPIKDSVYYNLLKQVQLI